MNLTRNKDFNSKEADLIIEFDIYIHLQIIASRWIINRLFAGSSGFTRQTSELGMDYYPLPNCLMCTVY